MRPPSLAWQRCLLIALLVLLAPAALRAQDVTEVTLKSAFLYNFVRFTEWPADALPPEAAVSVCVLGDPAVGEALTRAVKGRQISGHAVTVTPLAIESPVPSCHLLYVSTAAAKRVDQLITAVRDLPMLTVSDTGEFAKRGGIVQLVIEAGKMRFSINRRSVQRARLHLSSRLLALADIIDGGVSRVSPDASTTPRSPFAAPAAAEEPTAGQGASIVRPGGGKL